jgi:hypothetical protein
MNSSSNHLNKNLLNCLTNLWTCQGGGIGRHARLKILWAFVRAGSSPAPGTQLMGELDFLLYRCVI